MAKVHSWSISDLLMALYDSTSNLHLHARSSASVSLRRQKSSLAAVSKSSSPKVATMMVKICSALRMRICAWSFSIFCQYLIRNSKLEQ